MRRFLSVWMLIGGLSFLAIPNTSRAVEVLDPAPSTMSGYYANIGTIYEMTLTGSISGSLWGTDTYTYDSNLATAAVHAGVLANGATGTVLVKITPGQSSYPGSTQNGVTSSTWGVWGGSYEFVGSAILRPSVNSVTPNVGPTAGGTLITISGSNFTGATGITVGANSCQSFNVINASTATCSTPAGNSGTTSVVVTTPQGSSSPNSLFAYGSLSPQATLVVVPASASIVENGSTTLSTTGGSGNGGVSYALLSGPCSLNESLLIGNSVGNCVVVATKAGDSTYSAATSDQVTVEVTRALLPQEAFILTPNVTDIFLNQIVFLSTTGGSGTGNVSYNLVSGPCSLNGILLTGTGYGSCIVTATKASDGVYAATTSGQAIIYVLRPQSTLTAVATPNEILVTGTSALQTSGGNGSGAVTYIVNSGPCIVNGATLSATASGFCWIYAIKAADTTYLATESDPIPVTVNWPAPTIIGVSPSEGSTMGNTLITITGTNFLDTAGVNINYQGCSSYSVKDANTILCSTPTGVAGAANVVVTTNTGSAVGVFTYVTPLAQAITNIIKAGQSLVFSINQALYKKVTWSAVFRPFTFGRSARALAASTLVPICDITQSGVLTVIGDSNVEGTCDVTIIGSPLDGGPDLSSLVSIAVSPNANNTLVDIADITPSSGAVPGTVLTITGSNFTNVNSVRFGSIHARFTVLSSSRISVAVPLVAAGDKLVTVSDPNGADSVEFSYQAPPPSPPVNPIPTLSEWAQVAMMLLMLVNAGWYGRRMKQQ